MSRRLGPAVIVALLIAVAATHAIGSPQGSAITVHEWGTFTSVAGPYGEALEWLPLGGPSDLPCFVSRYPLSPKEQLSGTVRMETPVLYFYSLAAAAVDVRVRFPGGVITEWYPRAYATADAIDWVDVRVSPDGPSDFPTEIGGSRYYAARHTDAAPVAVGSQHEKFLFYRGVGRFAPPVTAMIDGSGTVTIHNTASEPVPDIVLFSRHDAALSYQTLHQVGPEARLNALVAADTGALRVEVEQMLTANGLYPAEAAAMVETWADSWFEPGSRLLYVVPAPSLAAILPLDITPTPVSTTRVFVGRVELITDSDRQAVRKALTEHDSATLARYGRFLDVIGQQVIAASAPEERSALQAQLQMSYGPVRASQTSCATTTTH